METKQEKLLAPLDHKTGGPASGMRLDLDDPLFRYKLEKGKAMRPDAYEDNFYISCLLYDGWDILRHKDGTKFKFDVLKLGKAVQATLGALE
jgi:hypothetical protein